jgi:hypothetical protein
MLPVAILTLGAPIVAVSTALELGAIVGISIAVIVCAGIPLTTGVAKGHTVLGIVFALITVPIAGMFGCIGGLPVACGFSLLISFIPVPKRPLLSQSEIENEMRKAKNY